MKLSPMDAVVISPQVPADILKRLNRDDRAERLRTIAAELFGHYGVYGLALAMRKHERTVRRWLGGETDIPVVVLVAAGAMLAAKRAGLSW